MSDLSIRVSIANRTYPLKIKASEEEAIRKAARQINEKISQYEEAYAVKDRQDLLAMCSLQIMTELLEKSGQHTVDAKDFDRLVAMENLIDQSLAGA